MSDPALTIALIIVWLPLALSAFLFFLVIVLDVCDRAKRK